MGDVDLQPSAEVSKSGPLLEKSFGCIEAQKFPFDDAYIEKMPHTFKSLDDTHESLDEQNKKFVSQSRSYPTNSIGVSINSAKAEMSTIEFVLENDQQKIYQPSSVSFSYLPLGRLKSVFLSQERNGSGAGYCTAVRKTQKSRLVNTESSVKSDFCINTTKTKSGVKKRKANPYLLWSSANRKRIFEMNKHLPVKEILKKVGVAWKALPLKEKYIWLKRAQELDLRNSIHSISPSFSARMNLISNPTGGNDSLTSKEQEHVLHISPVDSAAHLKLLGESLTGIGEKLLTIDCEPSIAGVYSVLLDSLLCSTGALLCLAREIPGLENVPEDSFKKTLDHLAYFFPGL